MTCGTCQRREKEIDMSSALVGTIVVVSAMEVWKASLSVIEVGENWTEVRVTRDVYRS